MNIKRHILILKIDEVEKMLKKMRECESADVHVVDEAICEELEKQPSNNSTPLDVEALILKHNIATWGSDLKSRMTASIQANEKKSTDLVENKFSLKSSMGDGSGKMKMKVKGGAVVDPDSGMDEEAHVMLEPATKEPYSCVLGLVDIARGSNSFYKLQIIEHDKFSRLWKYLPNNELEFLLFVYLIVCFFSISV